MIPCKEKLEISFCAGSKDWGKIARPVLKSTSERKNAGLASSIKSALYFLTVLGLTLSLPANVFAQPSKTESPKGAHVEEKASFLFVLRAVTGVITKTNGGYTLTLKGMDDKVLYFSDRPVRKAGFITLTQFMDDWSKGNDSFKKTPPNAAIVHAALYPSDKGRAQALAVELTNPTNTGDGWTFDMKVMGGGMLDEAVLSQVSVFVDQQRSAGRGGRIVEGGGGAIWADGLS